MDQTNVTTEELYNRARARAEAARIKYEAADLALGADTPAFDAALKVVEAYQREYREVRLLLAMLEDAQRLVAQYAPLMGDVQPDRSVPDFDSVKVKVQEQVDAFQVVDCAREDVVEGGDANERA